MLRCSHALQVGLFAILILPGTGPGCVVALGQATPPAAPPGLIPPELPVTPGLKVFDASLIDTAVDPCENFYRFSCNGWFKRNPLPADQVAYGRFTELYELNRLHLKQILEEAATPAKGSAAASPRSASEQKIGDEYASCMDTSAVNKLGLKPLEPELDRIGAMKTAADLAPLLAHLQRIGVSAFFGMGSNQDYADSSSVIAFYGSGGLGLPERDY